MTVLNSLLCLLVLAPMSACLAGSPLINRQYINAHTPPQPTKLLLLSPDIEVSQFTAGGSIEEVPEWTEAARQLLLSALTKADDERVDLELLPMPESEQLGAIDLDQHRALLETVLNTAWDYSRTWEHKREAFDYSIGPGLATLQEQSGADTALFISLFDVRSTGGRAATAAVSALFGVRIPMGRSGIMLSMVDLRNGNVIWMTAFYGQDDLNNARIFDHHLNNAFSEYHAARAGLPFTRTYLQDAEQ